ncbi:tRNA (adenosine(37)-N6)-threonylcarbamoyltransferase complex ATPase subunit type 1 TsaE [Candidatus Saccharibacteria bacterium]|nr:tRNA (adenosine(37)-N6)-threonylcarbamoyltransferase complex ATPase subunit type 1 TsaE [Candidatus Saccharibacteria bacterium]
MKIDSEQEMLDFGRKYATKIKPPTVIELIGDVGVGKTTFVRGLAKGLGIKEPITSPSFTISKTYAMPSGNRLVHYDFYRLKDPGLMAEDLNESISDKNTITIIEWSDTVSDLLPKDRIIIKIAYDEAGGRIIS